MSAKKKQVRQAFRDSVLKRDHNRCVLCKTPDNIEVHHITDRTQMPGGGYVKENGITLCAVHLEMAEVHHLSNGEDCAEGCSPTELYRRVSSNHEKALQASKRLEGYD